MGIMERMAHSMGYDIKSRGTSLRCVHRFFHQRKSIVMESKQTYKVKVSERVFKIDAHSKYHAIDKVYTAYCVFERDRSKYKIVK